MRWIKFVFVIMVLLGGGYFWATKTFTEQEKIVIEKEIPYSVEKLFPQFENLQNLTRWGNFLHSEERYAYTYFQPYEGVGSSVSFSNVKDKSDFGQLYLRSISPKKVVYDFYIKNESSPYKIAVKFVPLNEKTKLIWDIQPPKISILKSLLGVNDTDINGKVDKSLKYLSNILSGKVEREVMFSQIKYDSIMVEQQEERLLLGLNVNTNNRKGNLFKNINLTHNKLIGFVTKDLGKREDEFGYPILLTEVGGLKNKEVSYFYGVPLSKQVNVADNNFVYKKQEGSEIYTIYYKGKYDHRNRAINSLMNKIKKDSLSNGKLEELFIEYPDENKDVVLKISLPVYKKRGAS